MLTPELKKGSAEFLILALLEQHDRHGYELSKLIESRSHGTLKFNVSSLYPLLHRLDRLGYVEARWDSPPGGRRRRYYGITSSGRKALAEQRRQWEVVAGALGAAWNARQEGERTA